MAVPPPWTDPVRHALQQTFGIDAPDAVEPLTGGMSGAPVLKITVSGRPYVLRLDTPAEGFGDPRRWHRCMSIAADAGVAPAVCFADPQTGVSIVDFIAHDAQAYWALDRNVLVSKLGRLLSQLHVAPAFPPLVDYIDGLDMLMDNVKSLNLLSANEWEGPLAAYARLTTAYRRLEPQPVASHNDVNPRNLIYDGDRFWLIDWMSAFQADRYVDLAAIGSFVAPDEASEAAFLAAYFNRPSTEGEQARYALARLINHLFYGMVMLTTTGGERPASRRPLAELQSALRSGEPLIDHPAGRAEYALARLDALVEGVAGPRFEQACRLAA